MPRLRIIFAGSGEFGLPSLRALAGRHDVVQVVSQPDRPSGRGRKLAPTPVSQYALERGLPLLRTADVNREMLPDADVMVVIAFGQKIGEAAVQRPRLGSINLHASRLPRFRGAAPIHWAVLAGETKTGNSVIRLASRMDAGAVLAQSEVQIGELETTGELHERLSEDGEALVLGVLEDLAHGRAVETPQVESLATAAPKLSREQSLIDWTHPADAVARRIRGLSPWPGCRVRLVDAAGGEVARLSLIRARPVAGEGPRWEPGEVMIDGSVCTGDGWTGVEIVEIQPEGRRPMPLENYRRGNIWQPGLRLESIV